MNPEKVDNEDNAEEKEGIVTRMTSEEHDGDEEDEGDDASEEEDDDGACKRIRQTSLRQAKKETIESR